jgi:hypothetical protein
VSATIDPEPPESEREAILAALGAAAGDAPAGWPDAALAEGVDADELEP